jgi:predicted membrane chloride channel (bestrophin family)
MFNKSLLWKKWHIFIKLIPFLVVIVIIKLIIHKYGFEIISLNALFTSIVAATTFLIGFLITGVISDYKESERIPGEMASSLESLYDEAHIIVMNKKSKDAEDFIKYHISFIDSLNSWFYKKEKTKLLLEKLSDMNEYFAKLESVAQATFINRMKQEQSNIRKFIIRIHTIRETSFVQSAYAIVEALAFFLVIGLILLKLEPFYEAMFFVTIVSFLVLYMIFLIRDLDNPFDYADFGECGTEVSLKPLHDLRERIHSKHHKG